MMEALALQVPRVLDQLMNHPSVARYTLANEFYMNRTFCPFEKAFEDQVRSLDPTRMTREADPTCIGQRHGPYHFDLLSGAGYDCWGGRWDTPAACSGANFGHDPGCCPTGAHGPGCRYEGPDGGPGDPFEWSEFGANAISDVETLRRILPEQSLLPHNVGDSMWTCHKAGMWLDEGIWAPLFAPPSNTSLASSPNSSFAGPSAGSFPDIDAIVKASQFAQAEALRFAYQAARRRKPHRSLMASWTFDEPWPNAAHGCVVDYYGLPKMAFYWVRDALQMVDVALAYSDIHTPAEQQMRAVVWVDTEHIWLRNISVRVGYYDALNGVLLQQEVLDTTAEASPLAPVEVGRLSFTPPATMAGGVLMVRVTLSSSSSSQPSTATPPIHSDYFFGIREPGRSATITSALSLSQGGVLHPLLVLQNSSLTIRQTPSETSSPHTLSIEVTNTGSYAPALFVKPTVRDESGAQIGYMPFTRGSFTLLPGEVSTISLIVTDLPVTAKMVCVQAWNADQICLSLRVLCS